MAYLYKRKDSKFFWLRWRDENGFPRQISTQCRIGVAPEVKLARQMKAEKEMIEASSGMVGDNSGDWSWAAPFLGIRYRSSPLTLERYRSAWSNVSLFLAEKEIESPRQLHRSHCYDYLAWRRGVDKANGKYKACHNTALLELKALRIIMHEAVNRGIVSVNPCAGLGIKKERSKEKPELSAQDCEFIRSEIQKLPASPERQLLATSFEISRYQGCRLTETRLDPMTDVDLAQGTIRFRSAKGGKDFVTRLHPALKPLFERLQSEGKRSTWESPAGTKRQWASSVWWNFLDDIGLKAKGITFHGLRVTVVTELARANVHESKAQAFVGHASTTVHRIYQRLRPADLSDCTDVVGRQNPSSSNADARTST